MSAESAEQLQSSARLADALQFAQGQLGEAYASAVIDNAARTLTLYSTDAVPESVLAAINAMTKSLFRVEVVRVARSLGQLLAIQAVVNTLAATPAGRAISSTWITAATNQVHVQILPGAPADFVAEVLALAPPGAVEISIGESYFRLDGSDH